MRITIALPNQHLSPNARCHHMTKARATAKYRQMAETLAYIWMRSNDHTFPWRSAAIQLTFYFHLQRRRDPDNLLASCKAVFDGLRDAGVLDDDDQITHLPVKVKIDRVHPRLQVEVFEIGHIKESEGVNDNQTDPM